MHYPDFISLPSRGNHNPKAGMFLELNVLDFVTYVSINKIQYYTTISGI